MSETRGSDNDRWIGQVLQGRFELKQKLGQGGMGAVYRAEQQPLGRTVAVKLLSATLGADPVARQRFVREAQTLSKLHHPNVVVLHDFGTADDDSLFLVMEEVVGAPLRSMMGAALPWERAARLAWGIARGLGAAHHEGIVHADLKPENVMVVTPPGEPEQVKLLDFGLARLAQHETGDTLTQAGTIIGTPRYLSPEQIQGVRDDVRSDLYALGVILYEMVVGAPPFEAPAAALLLVSHLSEAPQPPSARGVALPPALEALILQLLSSRRTIGPPRRPRCSRPSARSCARPASTTARADRCPRPSCRWPPTRTRARSAPPATTLRRTARQTPVRRPCHART